VKKIPYSTNQIFELPQQQVLCLDMIEDVGEEPNVLQRYCPWDSTDSHLRQGKTLWLLLRPDGSPQPLGQHPKRRRSKGSEDRPIDRYQGPFFQELNGLIFPATLRHLDQCSADCSQEIFAEHVQRPVGRHHRLLHQQYAPVVKILLRPMEFHLPLEFQEPVHTSAASTLQEVFAILEHKFSDGHRYAESFNVWNYSFFVGHVDWCMPTVSLQQVVAATGWPVPAEDSEIVVTLRRRSTEACTVLEEYCILPHRLYLGPSLRWPLPEKEDMHCDYGWTMPPPAVLTFCSDPDVMANLYNWRRLVFSALPSDIRSKPSFYFKADLSCHMVMALVDGTVLDSESFIYQWVCRTLALGRRLQFWHTMALEMYVLCNVVSKHPWIIQHVIGKPPRALLLAAASSKPTSILACHWPSQLVVDNRIMDDLRWLYHHCPGFADEMPQFVLDACRSMPWHNPYQYERPEGMNDANYFHMKLWRRIQEILDTPSQRAYAPRVQHGEANRMPFWRQYADFNADPDSTDPIIRGSLQQAAVINAAAKTRMQPPEPIP